MFVKIIKVITEKYLWSLITILVHKVSMESQFVRELAIEMKTILNL